MKSRSGLYFLPFLTISAMAADVPAAPSAAQAMEAALARQREAAAAMQKSVSVQKESVARQVRQAVPSGFFLLAPPERTKLADAPRPASGCDPLPESVLTPLIEDTARRQDLEPDLLRSVVRQESAFRPCAVSSKGAIGLMQLMPATALRMGVKDPFNPRENIEGGAKFLKQLLDSYHDLPLALSAYNAGPGNVDPAEGVPHIPETMNYVRQILSVLPLGW